MQQTLYLVVLLILRTCACYTTTAAVSWADMMTGSRCIDSIVWTIAPAMGNKLYGGVTIINRVHVVKIHCYIIYYYNNIMSLSTTKVYVHNGTKIFNINESFML